MSFSVYILKCADQTLYTGIAKDVSKRIIEHNTHEKGAKYTRARRPVALVYTQEFENRSEAQKEECRIKKFTRTEKLKLVSSNRQE
jgi:putative endonuclease